jgi:hypothetical protein
VPDSCRDPARDLQIGQLIPLDTHEGERPDLSVLKRGAMNRRRSKRVFSRFCGTFGHCYRIPIRGRHG